jgi:photosystem II stability/assembly factor-like uncharacterized protein
MRNDAALNDVCFINSTCGWGAGDRGVIWHTADGGATWRQQTSNTTSNLDSVFFVDAHRGWAVGGESLEGRAATRGVVLRTEDGGTTWSPLAHHTLPRLVGVRFFDHDHGITFGQSASYAPSGVFTTHDGGSTWQALLSDETASWLAGDFLEPDIGAFAGPAGQLATLQRQKIVRSPLSASALRSFRAMRLAAPTNGWAVGDGGLIMMTHDLGRSWQTPPADLPRAVVDNFDFRAVAIQGTHVWIAGSPGSRIFHSPDSGQTWESIATGQSTPIRALTFIDADHGWAVGDLGNVLVTSDSGRTWKSQRTGGTRAALLGMFTDPTDVPLELLADSGAAEGYIDAVSILGSPAETSAEIAIQNTSERCQEALLVAGAASATNAWRFPIPASDLALAPPDLLQALNRENDGRALEQLSKYFVCELRTWRPDVVVTYHAAAGADNNLNSLVEQLVLNAVKSAGDPAQFSDLTSEVGLAPWQVKKVYGVLAGGERGEELIAPGRFSPWLGVALSDHTAPARGLLNTTLNQPPETYELKLLFSSMPESNTAHGIFGGISLAPGSEARRPQIELPTQDLEALRENATRRHHLQELLAHAEGSGAWAAQVSSMIDGLDADAAAPLLAELAAGYRKTGRLDLAADTYFMLARRFPDHPLVEPSLEWLVRFYASSEMAKRVQTRVAPANRMEVAANDSADGVRQASAVAAIPPGATPAVGLSRENRLHRAEQLVDYLKTTHPAMYADPAIRFAEVAAQRQLGFANPAERYFLTIRQMPESNSWRECAAAEEWLAKPSDTPPGKKLAACRVVDQPPHLDGKLDEPFWTHADHLRLSDDPSDAKHPTNSEVQLVHDSNFLYVAIHCRKSPNVDYSKDDSARPHDADLTQHDRVTLRLDTDRDYTTAFELTVDSRGWTRDACGDDLTWNPTWYVAVANDDETWTAEFAIPFSQLVEKPPAPRDVWAVSARRIVPRVGYQSWAGSPGAAGTPDQCGLLIFQ